jgi:hypothetical protein
LPRFGVIILRVKAFAPLATFFPIPDSAELPLGAGIGLGIGPFDFGAGLGALAISWLLFFVFTASAVSVTHYFITFYFL